MFNCFLHIVAWLIGKQPFTAPPAPPVYREESLPTWLLCQLRERHPWLARKLTIEHCEALVESHGFACKVAAGNTINPDLAVAVIDVSASAKPFGFPLFIWLMLGKLAIELLIWWFTQQQQQAAEGAK